MSASEAESTATRLAQLETALSARDETIARLRRYIPPTIASAILSDQERLRGERRDVTVLFVDAVGFTRLSVSLDAESVFNLINDLLGRLIACVHRYGGLVDKFTGDGLMAVFGAPVAHENDAELAIRAALDMREAAADFAPIARAQLGAPVQVRIGINRGPAIAGVLGTEEQSAYTVIGETVNVAARLEAVAQPGTILISEGVLSRTASLFEFSPRHMITIKGFDEPIAAYEALGSRAASSSTRGVPGMAGIYLGRTEQLERLDHVAEAFLTGATGRVVFVDGEAGLGKSRLISEWVKTLPVEAVTLWRGRGLPYAQGTGYGIFRSLLENAVESYRSPADWVSRLDDAFRPFVRRLLGLPSEAEEGKLWGQLDPSLLNRLTTLAIREWLVNEAAERPLVLVLDDFHWADDLSREALQVLFPLIENHRILFCVMSRPHAVPSLDCAAVASDRCDRLEVLPLSESESRSLLDSFVDLESLPATTVETILTRAEGNPFYIEEFVRALIERELVRLDHGRWRAASAGLLEDLEFPTSLRGLMLARVDRLPEDLRHLLQDASVVGLQFDAALLQEVEQRIGRSDNIMPMIDRLTELDLLELRPAAGPRVYAFRHILTQETVYHSILRNERPALHRMVAESIESIYCTALEEHAEILALHYDRARVREKALDYALVAGRRAQARFANREAISYYSRALQLSQHLGRTDTSRWQAAVGLGDVQQHIGEYEEATVFYRAALDEWTEAPPVSRAEVMLKLGRACDKLGNLEQAESWLKSAAAEISLAQEHTPAIEAEIYGALGWLNYRGGDLVMAQTLLERAAGLAEAAGSYSVLSSILNRLGGVYFSQGAWEEATRVVRRALEIRERLGDLLGVARSSNNLGILLRDSGDWSGALQTYHRSLDAMQAIGDIEGIAIAHTNIGNLHIDMGQWDEAEVNLRRSFDIAQRIANPYEKAQANMNLGRLYLRKGELGSAEHFLNTAISLYSQVGVSTNPNVIDACWLQAWLHLEKGQIHTAKDWSQRNHKLLTEGTGGSDGESPEWGRYHQLLGRLELAQGQVASALDHLGRAKDIFQANRSYAEAGRTAYWRAQAHLRADNPRTARDELLEAQSVFAELGAQDDLARVNQFLKGLEKATT
ncbi:MAG: tetratricopeptide repeat protein [Anaerolineae bacterium]|nr:tetratricopeptide repeat protein [Anaerolineae bacterium]